MASNNGTVEKIREMTRQRKQGFRLTCPMCGEKDAEIVLDLSDLVTLTCNSCGDAFAVQTAITLMTARLAEWNRLARWIDLAPQTAAPTSTES